MGQKPWLLLNKHNMNVWENQGYSFFQLYMSLLVQHLHFSKVSLTFLMFFEYKIKTN